MAVSSSLEVLQALLPAPAQTTSCPIDLVSTSRESLVHLAVSGLGVLKVPPLWLQEKKRRPPLLEVTDLASILYMLYNTAVS